MRLYVTVKPRDVRRGDRVALREHRRPRAQATVIFESALGGAGKGEPRRNTRSIELKGTEAHDG